MNMGSTYTECICATDPHCRTTRPLYQWSQDLEQYANTSASDVIPKVTTGCFVFDTLLLSTLECYYSYKCLAIHRYFINSAPTHFNIPMSEFQGYLLTYHPLTSRFPPNTLLSEIVNKMMIEKWNSSFSFDHYYDGCKPVYCSYSITTRQNNFIGLIILFLSTISGLNIALKLITPVLVNIAYKLYRPKIRRQPQGIILIYI